MGFGGAHALIPKMHGQMEFGTQGLCKFFGGQGAGAAIAGEMDGPSDDDGRALIAADQAANGADVIPLAGVDDGEERLCG